VVGTAHPTKDREGTRCVRIPADPTDSRALGRADRGSGDARLAGRSVLPRCDVADGTLFLHSDAVRGGDVAGGDASRRCPASSPDGNRYRRAGVAVGIGDRVCREPPDLVVLSEAGSKTGIEALQTALGEGGQSLHFAGLAVLSKDPLRLGVTLLEQRRTMVRLVDWDRPEGTVRLMVVDLPSELSVPRDPLLQKINRLIEEHQPDLVIGDFNAPRRSRAFSQLPAGYRHAFESAGQGCGYTWPILVPMLAIDHCLHGPRIVPVRYELRTSLSSDHRLQVFDAAIRP